MWVSLANFYIRQGLFEKARDIFEEALSKISTSRDFGLIFNSYLKFEEQLIKSEINEEAYESNKDSQIVVDNEMDKLINDTFSNLKLNKDLTETNKTKSNNIKNKHDKEKDNQMEVEEENKTNQQIVFFLFKYFQLG